MIGKDPLQICGSSNNIEGKKNIPLSVYNDFVKSRIYVGTARRRAQSEKQASRDTGISFPHAIICYVKLYVTKCNVLVTMQPTPVSFDSNKRSVNRACLVHRVGSFFSLHFSRSSSNPPE